MPTNRFAIKPLKVKLLAGEQKATEALCGCFVLFVCLRSGFDMVTGNVGRGIFA